MVRSVGGGTEPGDLAGTTRCPGSVTNPTAAPGELCLYEAERFGANAPGFCDADSNPGICNNTGGNIATKYGMFVLYEDDNGADNFGSSGTWAVTAP
jgi:hypothetical protein